MENSKDIRLLVLNVLKEGRLNIDEAEKILNYISQNESKDNSTTNKSSFQYPSSESISEFAKEGVSKIEKFVSGFGINIEKVAQNFTNKMNSKTESSQSNSSGTSSSTAPQGQQIGEKFTFNEEHEIVLANPIEKITLENNWGGIKVVGGEEKNIKLLVEKIIWTKNQDLANEKNQALKVNNINDDKNLQFVMPSSSGTMSDTINIELHVPQHLSFDLFTLNGDVLIQNIEGLTNQIYIKNNSGDTELKEVKVKSLDLLSVSGDLFFKDVVSQINARTTSGIVEIDGTINDDSRITTISGDIKGSVNVSDKIEISTSSGNLDIKQHKNQDCKMLDLMSHSGHITYNGVIHHTLRARTNSGNIKGRAIIANDADIYVNSNSGDINWIVDEDCNLSFKFENKSGDIFTNLLPEEVTKSENEVNGKIKEGLAKLSLSNVSGDLKFHKESVEVKV